jgi:hypothetical protein
MLAAVGVIAAFVPIVVIVSMLQRRGRLGPVDRRVPFAAYGPVLAGTLTGGAAAVHLGLIGQHAVLAASAPVAAGIGIGAAAFVCSIGAGAAHFASVDGSIGGFLPLGIASLGLAPVHAIWAMPRLWRRAAGAFAGLAVTVAVLGVGLAPILLGAGGAAAAPGATTTTSLGYSDVLGLVLEAALMLVFALLVLGRPRALLRRLEVRVADAWVGTGLGVAAVAIFSIVALVAGHAAH